MNELQETINELKAYTNDSYRLELIEEIERIVSGESVTANDLCEYFITNGDVVFGGEGHLAKKLLGEFIIIRKTECEPCECSCH